MKFVVKNSDIIRGLTAAIACSNTGAKSEYPDAGKVTIESQKDRLRTFANNGNVALDNKSSDSDSYTFETEGAVTVKSSDLSKILASFNSGDMLSFETTGNETGSELTVRLVSDNEQFQTMPVEVKSIDMPQIASKFDKEVIIPRDVFTHSLDRVSYALGFEKFKMELLYSVLRIGPGKIRSVAGCGSRFAVYQVQGDNIVQSHKTQPKKDINIVIHRDHFPVLNKVLSMCDEKILIREYVRNNDNDPLASQTVIESGDLTMTLIGHDPGIVWPDENQFIERVNTFKAVISKSELANVLKGMVATNNEDYRSQNEYHPVNIVFDFEKKVASFEASFTMRANRKVAIIDSEYPEPKLEFRVLSRYLEDIIKHGGTDGNVQFEFINSTSACVVRFFANNNITSNDDLVRTNVEAGTKEYYTVFFSAFKKKK